MAERESSETVRVCGVDLGAAEVKFTLCDAGNVVLHKGRSPSRGHPLTALFDLIAGLPPHLRDFPVRIAITGSGGVGDRPRRTSSPTPRSYRRRSWWPVLKVDPAGQRFGRDRRRFLQ
jgi:hypothetical protein